MEGRTDKKLTKSDKRGTSSKNNEARKKGQKRQKETKLGAKEEGEKVVERAR